MPSPLIIQVILDDDKCCGHGRCQALCPEVFDEDEAGYAVLRMHHELRIREICHKMGRRNLFNVEERRARRRDFE